MRQRALAILAAVMVAASPVGRAAPAVGDGHGHGHDRSGAVDSTNDDVRQDPPSAPDAGGFDVDAALGYAFRVVDPAVDDRAHGGAWMVGVAPRARLLGFGLRLQGLGLGFGGGDVTPRALGFAGAGPALTYAFDDTDVLAVAHVGGLAGMVVEPGGPAAAGAEGNAIVAGVVAGLSLRWALGRAAYVEAQVALPALFTDPRFSGWQAAALVGWGVSPDRLIAGLWAGESLASLLWP